MELAKVGYPELRGALLESLSLSESCIVNSKDESTAGRASSLKIGAWCRQENGSLHDPPMETSFGHWHTLLLSQDENLIIGRICAGNLNIGYHLFAPYL